MEYEPLAVHPDDRPGMAWNREIVKAADPDQRICFMANAGAAGDPRELKRYAYLFAAAPLIAQALKHLTFAARTSGGVAGRDDVLCAACEEAEAALAAVKMPSE